MLSWEEGLDDKYADTAAGARMLWLFRVPGLNACRSVGGFDGIDRDEWYREQLAGPRDILGAGLAGEQTVVADAVEALRQHVHQEAADELVDIQWHHLVSLGAFDSVILPLEGDAVVVA